MATRCLSRTDFCEESRETRLPSQLKMSARYIAQGSSPVILDHILLSQPLQEALVVCDDDELEVGLPPAFANDPGQSAARYRCDMFRIVGD